MAVSTEVVQEVATRHMFDDEAHWLRGRCAAANHADDVWMAANALH